MTRSAAEAFRLAALRETGLLDSPADSEYDAVARLAAAAFQAPVALVSLVDEDRQWFKASVGLDATEVPRDGTLCNWVILNATDPVVVPDAAGDPRFARSPLVNGGPGVRFYAGAPIVLADGARIGTLCVIDPMPRRGADPEALAQLGLLARLLASKADLDRRNRQLDAANRALARQLEAGEESERQLRDIAETGPGVLFQWVEADDGRRGFSWVSPRAQAVLALDPVALMADWKVFRIHADDLARWVRTRRAAARDRAEWRFEGRYWRPDGDLRWWRAHARPGDDRDGAVRYNGILLDITEQKRREIDLLRRERVFREITDAMPTMISYIRTDGTFLLANATSAQAVGLSRDALIGRTLQSVLPPEIWAVVQPHFRRAVAGERVRFEADGGLADGTSFALRATYIPDRGDDGAVMGIHAIVEDLRDVRSREARLIADRDAARETDRAKTTFLATMSHELRTPLNAIIGYSEMMQAEMLGPLGSPVYRGYLCDIVRSGRHLSLLLSDILDLARIESGELALTLGAVRIDSVLRECIDMATPSEQARLVVGTLAPARVTADRRAARQVFANVLSNALNFSGSDQPVAIALTASTEGWVLSVSDNGAAIPDDELPRLTDPFAATTGSAMIAGKAGLRIGLAVANRLCEALGWRLDPEGRAGRGTTVRVSIPA